MVEISGARLGSILLGGFYSATGAIKLFRMDPFTQLHDDQVKTLKQSFSKQLSETYLSSKKVFLDYGDIYVIINP